jgi:hypothetical protein
MHAAISRLQGLSEEFGGPVQILNLGALFFPNNVSKRRGRKNVFGHIQKQKFQQKFSGQILVKSLVKHIFRTNTSKIKV